MGAFDDITRKAQGMMHDKKVREGLHSEKAEGISDRVLDGAAGAADKVAPEKHDDAIRRARDAADKRIGDR